MKKWGWWLVVGLFTLFIFSNSLATGSESGHLSMTIAQAIHQFLSNLSIQLDLDLLHFLVRKAAHFSEYAGLGILLMIAFHVQPIPWFTTNLHKAVFFLIPIVDETLQRFSPGRSCEIRDMIIDSCGMLTGMILAFGLLTLIVKWKKGETKCKNGI